MDASPGRTREVEARDPASTGAAAASVRLALRLAAAREQLESQLSARLGTSLDKAAPEFEALRRYRSYVLAALAGHRPVAVLDGLRVAPHRAGRWIGAWTDAAIAGLGLTDDQGEKLRLLERRFRASLRATEAARTRSGPPRRSGRRAVASAIDRIVDGFLAVDVDSGEIVDANPAAGALLGTSRDALLGTPVDDWVHRDDRDALHGALETLAEGGDHARGDLRLRDRDHAETTVEWTAARFVSRGRVLALVLARALETTRGGEARV